MMSKKAEKKEEKKQRKFIPEVRLKRPPRKQFVVNKRHGAGTLGPRNRRKPKEIFIRAEKLVSKYRSADRCKTLQKRMAKLKSKYVIPPETKLLVAVRQKGRNIPHRSTLEILNQLGLRQIH